MKKIRYLFIKIFGHKKQQVRETRLGTFPDIIPKEINCADLLNNE